MIILNFGSLNIDYVYAVDHFVSAGETIGSYGMDRNVGGKGLNQSVAFAKAGASVYHAGSVGSEGGFLTDYLKKVGVNTDLIRVVAIPTGNAIIQVDKTGQNCILLFGGANQAVTEEMVDEVLSHLEKGDMVILQNEISQVDYILKKAYDLGITTVLNPSPITEKLLTYPLGLVDWFILNEIEGKALTDKTEPADIMAEMRKKFPSARVVLTLGKDGAMYFDAETAVSVPAGKGKPVDTTAAGDTFTGYFFTAVGNGKTPEEALRIATKASDITVTRKGAAESIPFAWEIGE
jgi:ribokinase